MDMEEIWRDIKGYEGLYQVSNFGRVKSLNYNKTGKERVLVIHKDRYGYLQVGLYKDGKLKTSKVHRLVAQAFISNPDGYREVNHKDEDKSNNVASNLEWCSNKYNVNYGTARERMAKALSKPVFQYTMDGSLVKSYPSVMEAGRRTGYSYGNISACCNSKRKKAYGYFWSYALLPIKGKLF